MAIQATPAEQASELLRRISAAYDRRRELPPDARAAIDAEIAGNLDALATIDRRPLTSEAPSRPPRHVQLAMATAAFGQPHLAHLLGDASVVGTEDVDLRAVLTERPVVITSESLQEAIGLAGWELDDIREDVDRRVGIVLKQARALRWLWSHFGLPQASAEPLFRVLFPGAPGRFGRVGMIRFGTQLYAVVDEPAPPLEAVFLPWVEAGGAATLHPMRSFHARYVSADLRRALARGIGATEDETLALLDRMITVLPRSECARFVAADAWRARGAAAITDLPGPYSQTAWLARAIEPDDVPFGSWLRIRDGQIDARDPRAAFDVLALRRANEMLRQIYGAIVARAAVEATGTEPRFGADDVALLDVEHHLRAVLEPIVAWARAPRTHTFIGGRLGIAPEAAAAWCEEAARAWTEQIDAVWCGPADATTGPTVKALVTEHLVATIDSIRRLLARPPSPELPHRDVLLLFCAQHFTAAPLERLWAEANEGTWPGSQRHLGDAVGAWFWPLWSKIVDLYDSDTTIP